MGKYVEANPDKPWVWSRYENSFICWSRIDEVPQIILSDYCHHVTWEIVEANPDKPWNWVNLSSNSSNLTWEIVEANPDKPWNW